MERNTPQIYLEQYALGELPPERIQTLDHPDTAYRLIELEESNKEILSHYSPEEMSRKITERLSGKEAEVHRPRFSLRPVLPVAAAAFLALGLILPLIFSGAPEKNAVAAPGDTLIEEGVRLKGLEPGLHIYRKNGETVELMQNANTVQNYDLLQMSYIAAGKKYGMIFSIDGNGFVTLHYPDFTGASPELQPQGEIPLDFSYQLDDAPGFERFFFVTSDSYFSVDAVLESASRLASSGPAAINNQLDVPKVCDTLSLLLLKEGSNE